jgi:hypothetical protein
VREIDEQCGTTIAVDFIKFIENLLK